MARPRRCCGCLRRAKIRAGQSRRRYLIERLARRFAASDTDEGYAVLAKLLDQAPEEASIKLVVSGMEQAMSGLCLQEVPAPLQTAMDRLWRAAGDDHRVIQLALRMNSDEAYQRALAKMIDIAENEDRRLAYINAVGQAQRADAVEPLLRLAGSTVSDALVQASLAALERFEDVGIGRRVLALYGKLSPAARTRAFFAVMFPPELGK